MTHATYFVQGPLRAQDGRTVYVVVRVLRDSRAWAVMECLTRETAQREADQLNQAVDRLNQAHQPAAQHARATQEALL